MAQVGTQKALPVSLVANRQVPLVPLSAGVSDPPRLLRPLSQSGAQAPVPPLLNLRDSARRSEVPSVSVLMAPQKASPSLNLRAPETVPSLRYSTRDLFPNLPSVRSPYSPAPAERAIRLEPHSPPPLGAATPLSATPLPRFSPHSHPTRISEL